MAKGSAENVVSGYKIPVATTMAKNTLKSNFLIKDIYTHMKKFLSFDYVRLLLFVIQCLTTGVVKF